MPKTKFQNIIFSLMMVLVMVYGMVCYNISISMGGLNNQIFLIALKELPIMVPIALIIEIFFVGEIVKKITFKLINPKEVQPIFITIMISSLTVAFMCPIMSFIATILFNFNGLDTFISSYIERIVINFPMAFFYQIFYAGPLVRFIFRKIFK